MTLYQALGLGVLQGATEFLPVSSSGHLVLAQNWLPDVEGPQLLFDVVVHLGTLAAIALVLRARLWSLARAALSFLPGVGASEGQDVERRWVILILVASVPTAIIGLGLRDVVEGMHGMPAGVGGALLVTALLLISSERFGSRSRGHGDLGMGDAIVVGVAQGLGVIPGISRSGVTVATALWRGTRGDVAVEFSILMSVPAVLGASVLELGKSGLATVSAEILPLVTGFLAAFATGCVSLKALQWVVTRRKLLPFAIYCALVGAGALILG